MLLRTFLIVLSLAACDSGGSLVLALASFFGGLVARTAGINGRGEERERSLQSDRAGKARSGGSMIAWGAAGNDIVCVGLVGAAVGYILSTTDEVEVFLLK